MDLKIYKKDFKDFNNAAFGILLYGSCVRGDFQKRSDIDICIVKPDNDEVIRRVNRRLGGKYDMKVFENMPLYIQIEVIKNHQVIYGDTIEISAYFYKFRRLWEDMAKRIHDNRFGSVDERMVLYRRWMHEKRAILGEIGSL